MLSVFALLAAALLAQAPGTPQTTPPDSAARHQGRVAPPTDSTAVATHADVPPAIDGREDDAVWRVAPAVTEFMEWRPTEGKAPRFRTEAKFAYDAGNLYVFVRAFDPHPDSIIKILERRDTFTASDMIWVWVDAYHDRRTGYEFGVNAAGVKIDLAMYDDGREDQAWDAVWDVATRIDSTGWTAEYRIPLSQLHYSTAHAHTFGVAIGRDLYRYSERFAWPKLSQAKAGFVSQWASLSGLDDLEPPRKLEVTPYVVTKQASRIVDNRFTNQADVTAGGDFKYQLASNLTLDGTINPDFGQVESDPAVLNLSAYESFFDERRPFFVAGRGLFDFGVNCNQVNCSGENLYYSRRIGRTPELASTYGDTVPQRPTTILGAAKLLGRFHSGLTFGVLDAVTQRDANPGDTTYAAGTNYAVARVRQDLQNGASAFGGMFTAVDRGNDRWVSPYLPSSAYVGAVDGRHRFDHDQYEVSGTLDASRVQGSQQAIRLLQTNSVHLYQRPDAALPLDSTRTMLGGDAEELKLDKVGGEHLLFESAYQRRSPGFEVNDLGYLRRADQTSWSTWVGYFDRKEHWFYQRFQWNNNWWQYWTTAGLPLEAAYNTNVHITFKNNWGWHMGGTVGQLGATYDDRAARGGPAVRQDWYLSPWLAINGDDRRAVVPYLNLSLFRGNDGRARFWNFSPEIDYKLLHRFSSAISVSRSHNIDNGQWYGNFTDAFGATHYTFAHLDQTTTSATVRLNYTFTPAVSLQVYAQPFVSKGTYSNIRELSATPRAADYDARYIPYADSSVSNNPGGFDFKELQSNVVFRWEYRPGSTLFVVWNEGRQGSLPFQNDRNFGGDLTDLLRLHPANTFLVKMSYYLTR